MASESWHLFAASLRREMSRSPALSSADLERRLHEQGLHVTADQISNWRRRRARPELSALRTIVDALNRDRPDSRSRPFSIQTLLEDMEIIPRGPVSEELFAAAYRLNKLQLRLEDAAAELSAAGRRSGASRIVQRAMDTQEWSVAVSPAVEGPDDNTRMHVADRLSIVRVNGEPSSKDAATDVWADRRMKQAIRGTYALPSDAGPDVRWPVPPSRALGKPTQWSISYVSSPRSAVASQPWEGLRSLAFVATTPTSWANNVASLVALNLGYGFVTTSDIAMNATGRAIDRTTHEARTHAHREMLARLPARRVWSHYGVPDGTLQLFGHSGSDDPASQPRFVFLDESDERLRHAPEEFEVLQEARTQYREQAAEAGGRVLTLKCEYIEDRSNRWAQAFTHSLQVLQWLAQGTHPVTFPRERLAAVREQVRDREGAVATPAFRWFEARGWSV